jgi:hypothetical protein
MKKVSYDRINSGRELRVLKQGPTNTQSRPRVRVEDQGDGTTRLQLDQIVPWSVAVELLNALAATTAEDGTREEMHLLS